METPQTKDPDLELIKSLASKLGVDANSLVEETDVLEELANKNANLSFQNAKWLDLIPSDDLAKELEIKAQKSKEGLILMWIRTYRRRIELMASDEI